MSDSPIEQILRAAAEALQARRQEALQRVERVRAAADAYLRAVDQELAAQFAARNGLAVKLSAPQVARAAQELRTAVDAIPDVGVGSEPPGVSLPPSRSLYPPRDSLVPRAEGPASAPVDALLRDLRATNFDELPEELLRISVEEFAARARHLQDTAHGRAVDDEALARAIRTLTAVVSRRGVTGIHGLSRSHTGDWQARADDAARRRERWLAEAAPAGAGLAEPPVGKSPPLAQVRGTNREGEEGGSTS